jgi:parallel beta-helix repeat protein
VTIVAENERQALIDATAMNSTFAMFATHCSYWSVLGLHFQSADQPGVGLFDDLLAFNTGDHITVRRNIFDHNNRYCNCEHLLFIAITNSLIEENEFYYFHRSAVVTKNGSNNTYRRNYANSRLYADIPSGFVSSNVLRGDAAFNPYPESGDILENNISENNDDGIDIQATATSDSNQELGNISLNDYYGATEASRNPGTFPTNTTIKNAVVINPNQAGIYPRGALNTQVSNVSVFGSGTSIGIVADAPAGTNPAPSPSFFCTGCLSINNSSSFGFEITATTTWTLNYTVASGNGTNYSPAPPNANITNASTSAPTGLGTCYAWIPAASNLHGAGLGGSDIGANVLYEYVNGILTTARLWDASTGAFPHGAAVGGLNDVAGQSAFDVQNRLHVNTGGCSFPAGYTGATYYVRTTAASDAGSCASATTNDDAHAKKTVAGGIACLTALAGDTLMLNDGTYDTLIPDTIPSGSMGAPTTIKAVNNRMAVIKPTINLPAGGVGVIWMLSRSYIRFDGIAEDGANTPATNDGFRLNHSDHIDIVNSEIHHFQHIDNSNCSSTSNAVEVTDNLGPGTHGSTFDQFTNNYIHDIGGFCAGLDNNYEGLGYYIQESDNTIDGNTFVNIAEGAVQFRNGSCDAGAGLNNILRNSSINGSPRVGIFIANCTSGTQVYNVTITGVTNGGYGVNFYADPANVLFANNTIYGNTGGCIYRSSSGSTQVGNTIENNLCYMNNGVGINTDGMTSFSGETCSNNFNIAPGCNPTEGMTDPLFAAAGSGDFHVNPGSPAAGFGTNLCGTFCTDFDGNPRPSMGAWDAGAFIANATTYYVRTTGDDTHPCALATVNDDAHARQTIGGGVGCLVGGNTLIVGDGNYDEQDINPPVGSMGAPTIIQAANRNAAKIRPANTHYGFLLTHSHITIDGFYIDCNAHFVAQCGGVLAPPGSALTDVTVKNGTVYKAGGDGTNVSEGSAIEGDLSNSSILNNDIIDTGRANSSAFDHAVYVGDDTTDSHNTIIDGNRITNTYCQSIVLYHSNHANVIRNNTVTGDTCVGILISLGAGNSAYNNVVYGNFNGIDVSSTPVTSAFIYNNTLFNNSGYALSFDNFGSGLPSGVIAKNNIFYMDGHAINDATAGQTCSNNLNAGSVTPCGTAEGMTDPLFVNAAAGNFHIRPGSPAAGTGLDLSATFTTDADGNPRTTPWSIGAYIQSCVINQICLVQLQSSIILGPGGTLSQTLTIPETTGNLNIITITYCPDASCVLSNAGGSCSITDSQLNSYPSAILNLGTTGVIGCVNYAKNITGGANTITVNTAGISTPYYLTVNVSEWVGADKTAPLDHTGTNNGTGTSLSASATATTGDLVLGFGANINGGEVIGAGFNQMQDARNQYEIAMSSGTATATWTSNSGPWLANVATFKPAGATNPIAPILMELFRRHRQ